MIYRNFQKSSWASNLSPLPVAAMSRGSPVPGKRKRPKFSQMCHQPEMKDLKSAQCDNTRSVFFCSFSETTIVQSEFSYCLKVLPQKFSSV
ncbi:hypothetical protein TNIN_289031 [Trichonephila inaurata madagascariensis]|uniref:Uncharacterized protein n=1 Tax=Trichonephila inaurata madagascariensis TaxID=2747483 RepID=A0A8X6XJ47_9ARAC|nr:hypothetical protein TNIN_289031 [Trichonephila inaurata madagascariensis]